jgi:hypothetical protein
MFHTRARTNITYLHPFIPKDLSWHLRPSLLFERNSFCCPIWHRNAQCFTLTSHCATVLCSNHASLCSNHTSLHRARITAQWSTVSHSARARLCRPARVGTFTVGSMALWTSVQRCDSERQRDHDLLMNTAGPVRKGGPGNIAQMLYLVFATHRFFFNKWL